VAIRKQREKMPASGLAGEEQVTNGTTFDPCGTLWTEEAGLRPLSPTFYPELSTINMVFQFCNDKIRAEAERRGIILDPLPAESDSSAGDVYSTPGIFIQQQRAGSEEMLKIAITAGLLFALLVVLGCLRRRAKKGMRALRESFESGYRPFDCVEKDVEKAAEGETQMD
jgi:hypothetical protein